MFRSLSVCLADWLTVLDFNLVTFHIPSMLWQPRVNGSVCCIHQMPLIRLVIKVLSIALDIRLVITAC